MKHFDATGAKQGKAAGPRAFDGHLNVFLERHSKSPSALWWAGNRPDSEKDDDVKQSLKVPHRSCWLRRRHTKETNWLKSEPEKNSLLAGNTHNSKVPEATEAAQAPEIRPLFFLVCLRTNQPTANVSAVRIDSKLELKLLVCPRVHK